MEAFTFLKYWRGGPALPLPPSSDAAPTSRAAVQNENATETDDDDNDDGPFFDLEFTVPDEDTNENPNTINTQQQQQQQDEEEEEEEEEEDNINVDESDGEGEFKFTLSPSSNDRSDPNLSLSPSEDLFFKGKLVHVDPSSFSESEPNSKPQFTASLLKSATKFRVFMLGLKKPKPTTTSDKDSTDSAPPEAQNDKKKHFTVKFKVEEVPIVSLLRSKANKTQTQKHTSDEQPSEEKRFSKEVMHKYLKMVKPLYIRVSRRYGEKLNLSSAGKAPVQPPTAAEPELSGGETTVKNNNTQTQTQKLHAGLSVVCKHLGKSRSASSAVAAAPATFVSSNRRDDSLLQQQDGIQGAILHCKRSFNGSRTECESSQLARCVSHTSQEISMNEGKDKRLST